MDYNETSKVCAIKLSLKLQYFLLAVDMGAIALVSCWLVVLYVLLPIQIEAMETAD